MTVWARLAPLLLVLAGCSGSSTASSPWGATHPDTTRVEFVDQSGAGLCAVTAPYPEEAPAVLRLLGATYVQKERDPVPESPHGVGVDHSGDWYVYRQNDGTVLLTSPTHTYHYAKANC